MIRCAQTSASRIVSYVRLSTVAVFAAALSTACVAETLELTRLALPDAGFPDAGFRDGGVPRDAGFPRDGGFRDGGFFDSGVPPATEVMYLHDDSNLFAFDATTGTRTLIGPFLGVINSITDIAIDANGRLYAGDFASNIYVVDPETADLTYQFSVSTAPTGLGFTPDGRLVVGGSDLIVVDPVDGRLLQRYDSAAGLRTSGDIVALPDGFLYVTIATPTPGDALYRLDPMSGESEFIRDLPHDNVWALGFANDRLYGLTADGFQIEMDPANDFDDVTTQIGGRWYGATTNPVRW